MSTVRSSTASTVTNLLGTISTTASVLTLGIDSIGQLAAAGNTKARFYAKRVQDNAVNQDFHYRNVDQANTSMAIALHQEELLTKFDQNPRLKDLFMAAQKQLEELHNPSAKPTTQAATA